MSDERCETCKFWRRNTARYGSCHYFHPAIKEASKTRETDLCHSWQSDNPSWLKRMVKALWQ